jgi:competence protein ComEC
MRATISCVDVGQGDATVAVDHTIGAALVIDCRQGHHGEVVAELRRLGAKTLAIALVTHSHMDHFGGVLDVLEELGEEFGGDLYLNHDTLMAIPVPGDDRGVAGRKLRALLTRAREFGSRVHRAEVPADGSGLGGKVGDISWTLLAPTFDDAATALTSGNPNLASGVVLLTLGEDNFVIGADAQAPTWSRLRHALPKEAVVRWPHHGGALSADPDDVSKLFDALRPAVVLVSVGATNAHGHPTEEFFSAAGGRPGRLYCTQATPACVAGAGPGGVCAGTIRVESNGDGHPSVLPAASNHGQVVAAFGNGRCQIRPA